MVLYIFFCTQCAVYAVNSVFLPLCCSQFFVSYYFVFCIGIFIVLSKISIDAEIYLAASIKNGKIALYTVHCTKPNLNDRRLFAVFHFPLFFSSEHGQRGPRSIECRIVHTMTHCICVFIDAIQ